MRAWQGDLAVKPSRAEEYWEAMKEYRYDNIERLMYRIQGVENRIALYSKYTGTRQQILPAKAEKQSLVTQLQVLEAGWEKIAESFRTESLKLFKLPIEIRERIYSYLYTRQDVIFVQYPTPKILASMQHLDVKRAYLPIDPYLYLNASIVDPAIAVEAARVFYDTNTFQARDTWYDYGLPELLKLDCFGIGVQPWDIIKRLHIVENVYSNYQQLHPDAPSDFEEEYRVDQAERPFSMRTRMAPLLEMKILRVLELCLIPERCNYGAHDFRGFLPILKILKSRGVVVRVSLKHCNGLSNVEEKKDISRYFDEPTPEDCCKAENLGGIDFMALSDQETAVPRRADCLYVTYDDPDDSYVFPGSDDEADVEEMEENVEESEEDEAIGEESPVVEQPVHIWYEGTDAQWRVHLTQHFRAFEKIELEGKMEALKKAKANIDAIFRALQQYSHFNGSKKTSGKCASS